ncbi:Receptor-like protein kinase HSL1 [Hordeum vulgare]|nr:Receptor-like protein kinase HSL1 [Hordeum vulgare]
MTQNDANNERKRQEKEEQMKAYMELQAKKLDMENAAKRRKLDMEEVIQRKKVEIEATNASTKGKEVVLFFMTVDLTKMSPKRSS